MTRVEAGEGGAGQWPGEYNMSVRRLGELNGCEGIGGADADRM